MIDSDGLLDDPRRAAGEKAAAWRPVYEALRLCGEIAVARKYGNVDESRLASLSKLSGFGRHRSEGGNAAEGTALHAEVVGLLEECRRDVVTPVPAGHFADEAVMCWWCHVVNGVPIKAVPSFLRSDRQSPLLEARWPHPDKTVRERMWVAREWRSPKVTGGSMPGLARIVERWTEHFGLPVGEPEGAATEAADPTQAGAGDAGAFLGDVAVPNGSVRAPGDRFTKIWRIQNAGSVAWTRRFLTRMGATGGALPKSPRQVHIPDTPAGGITDVAVQITAPRQPGTYETYWIVTDAHGAPCFHGNDELTIVFTFLVRSEM